MWVQLVLLTAQMFLGEVTRPRPKRIGFEEFKQDNAPSELRPIPYVAGTVELIPSRIWFGDYTMRAVERDSQWTDWLFFGALGQLLDFITVAYRYYCGEAFSLCYGDNAHVEMVRINDRIMYYSLADNAGGGFLIDDPQAWGGDQPPGEGGQYSWMDLTRGNYSDATNPYLESMLSTPPFKTPSLRGVSVLISRGRSGFTESGFFAAGGVGFIPKFKEWKVTVRRQPNNLVTAWSKIGRHANPMEVLYEWATSFEYGARLPPEYLNLTSLRVAAETLFDEGLGWSGKIEDTTNPLEVAQNVAAQVDAVLDPSPSLGLTVRLVRRDYSIASLPLLDRSVITGDPQYAPGTYEDTVNKIIIPFNDHNNNSLPRPGLYIDPANQRIQGGRIVPQTQNYRGVADFDTANLLATRDGRALAVPRPPLSCTVLPSWGKLRYMGEVVQFEWASPSFSKVMRITAIQPGTAKQPDYHLELIEDQFATGARTSGEPATSHADPAVGLATAPPSASWDESEFPPDGLELTMGTLIGGAISQHISGAIEFGVYNPGGQYARVYVTEPGGVQALSPIYLAPDADNKAQFQWPALVRGDYTFCIQTYSLRGATNGVKVCATIAVASSSPSASVSPSVSPSASASPSASESPSPSASTSPSASQSPSASVSPSASASASTSPSVSPSVSPSASVSPSTSPSGSASPSASASLPPGFDSIADLELLHDASEITGKVEDDAITQWDDISGNGRHATAAGGGSAVLYRTSDGPNGLPSVRWQGLTQQYLASPDFASGFTEGHVFCVVKADNGTGNSAPPVADWGTAGDDYYGFNADGKLYDGWGSTARHDAITPTTAITNWLLYEVRSAAGAWSLWLNGVQQATTAINIVAFSTALKLGATATGNKRLTGNVHLVAMYSRVLNAGEVTTIYDHVEAKAAIVLP